MKRAADGGTSSSWKMRVDNILLHGTLWDLRPCLLFSEAALEEFYSGLYLKWLLYILCVLLLHIPICFLHSPMYVLISIQRALSLLIHVCVYSPAFLCWFVSLHTFKKKKKKYKCMPLSDFAPPSWLHSRAQQHVNGGRQQQSCHRGAGGAAGLHGCHSRIPEPEPHPLSAPDAHRPVAGHSGSHEEPQSHSLHHSLTHTVAEVQLSPHTRSLSHDQGGEGSAGLCGEVHKAQRTLVS